MENTKDKKSKKQKKQDEYDDAMKKVEENINRIYDDAIVGTVMTNIRCRLKIDSDMYKKCEDKTDKMLDIYNLVEFLTDLWIGFSLRDEKNKKNLFEQVAKDQIIKRLEEHKTNALYEEGVNASDRKKINEAYEEKICQLEKTSNDEIAYTENNFSETIANAYFKEQIDKYVLSNFFLLFPVHVNLNIWKNVVAAKLFNVPIEKVLQCKQLILEKDYLPKVETINGLIYIKINELTTQGDLALAWDRVEKAKEEYRNKYNYLYSERGCKKPILDRVIWNYSESGLKPKAISDKLFENGQAQITADQVSWRLKEIKKRMRASERDKLLLRYGG
jgi:hypothetical protein